MASKWNPKIGKTIKAWREEQHLTQEQLADALDTSVTTIQNWEGGCRMDLDNLFKVAKYFGRPQSILTDMAAETPKKDDDKGYGKIPLFMLDEMENRDMILKEMLHHRLNDEESELLGLCQLYGFEHLPYEYVQKKGLIEVYRIRNHMQGHLNGLDDEMIWAWIVRNRKPYDIREDEVIIWRYIQKEALSYDRDENYFKREYHETYKPSSFFHYYIEQIMRGMLRLEGRTWRDNISISFAGLNNRPSFHSHCQNIIMENISSDELDLEDRFIFQNSNGYLKYLEDGIKINLDHSLDKSDFSNIVTSSATDRTGLLQIHFEESNDEEYQKDKKACYELWKPYLDKESQIIDLFGKDSNAYKEYRQSCPDRIPIQGSIVLELTEKGNQLADWLIANQLEDMQ